MSLELWNDGVFSTIDFRFNLLWRSNVIGTRANASVGGGTPRFNLLWRSNVIGTFSLGLAEILLIQFQSPLEI